MVNEHTDSSPNLTALPYNPKNLSATPDKQDKTLLLGQNTVNPSSFVGRLGPVVFTPQPYLSGAKSEETFPVDVRQENSDSGHDAKGAMPSLPESRPPVKPVVRENTINQKSEPYLSYGPGFSQALSADGPKSMASESLARTNKDDFIGSIYLGKYELISQLGSGGMGVIYKARQIFLDRIVAIKMLRNNMASSKARMRFHQEARAASGLNHPGVVAINDFGIDELDRPYMVMEYVEGVTLQEVLREHGLLNMRESFPIFIEILEALAVAHARGVIHRDIKPSNVMLAMTTEGGIHLKLLDFGIAKVLDVDDNTLQDFTRTGEALGTPLYMSPEQIQSNQIDFRSDLYSFGCLMYVCLTGNPPHMGESKLLTMEKHICDKPASLKEASMGLDFPPTLEAVIMRLLEKSPGDRFQSADEVRQALIMVARQIGFLPPINPAMLQQGREPFNRAAGLMMAQSISQMVPAPSGEFLLDSNSTKPRKVERPDTDWQKTELLTNGLEATKTQEMQRGPGNFPNAVTQADFSAPHGSINNRTGNTGYPGVDRTLIDNSVMNTSSKFDEYTAPQVHTRSSAFGVEPESENVAAPLSNGSAVRKPQPYAAPVHQGHGLNPLILVVGTAFGVALMIGFGAFLAYQLGRGTTPVVAPPVTPAGSLISVAPSGAAVSVGAPVEVIAPVGKKNDELDISEDKELLAKIYPNSSVLRFRHNHVSDKVMLAVAKLGKLDEFELTDSTFTLNGLKLLKNMKIGHLVLNSSKIHSAGSFDDKALSLISSIAVDWLDLSRTRVSDEGVVLLANNNALTSLDISTTEVTTKGLKALARLPHLKTLYLRELKWDASGLAAFVNHPSLKFLYLDRTPLSLEQMRVLNQLGRLEGLNMNSCGLDETKLALLTNLNKVVQLGIRNNALNNSALKVILKNFKNLANLFWSGNTFDSQTVELLVHSKTLGFFHFADDQDPKVEELFKRLKRASKIMVTGDVNRSY
jgi:serine/threonine protein kinase